MRLTVFNGSPRGRGSNTKTLLDHFLKGFSARPGNTYQVLYLSRAKERDRFPGAFGDAEHVFLAFPLYVDAMPSIVKSFIESLAPVRGRDGNPPIGFLVQSGFPEAVHSRYVERYLRKLARRLGCKYAGTVIKGGVESIRGKPPLLTKRLFRSFYKLGEAYGISGQFDREMVEKLAKPERLSGADLWLNSVLNLLGLYNHYWNSMLKRNGTFQKRFDRPYAR